MFFDKVVGLTIATMVTVGALSTDAVAQCKKAENTLSPIAAGTSAFYVRKLQSDMMVAALGCGMRAQYNMFATSYQSELKRNSAELLSMFKVQHGASGQRKHTSFLTSMANDASLRMASSVDYCVGAKLALDQLTNANRTALEKVASAYFISNQTVVAARDDSCPQLTSLPAQ
mgnify:CR=1 FL=1